MPFRWTAVMLASVLATTGCLEQSLIDCGNGTLCPANKLCVASGCASAAEVAACAGLADGDACESDRGPGVCAGEVCVSGVCGDGHVDAVEVCDDGNRVSGDGCSGTCTSDETCGNGIVELAEACDCGDANHPGLPACAGTSNGGERCRDNCELPRCGNGNLEPLEICDDGNTASGDGCAGDCASNETCGNGVTDFGANEQCDDGNLVDHDGCQHTCKIQRCGDGIRDIVDDEACDDGNLASGDGCSPDCVSDESCGNGTLDFFAGEQCDDGNKRSHDGCHSQCRIETPTWVPLGPEQPGAHVPALAYDTRRERVVLFVGDYGPDVAETYELGDTGWIRTNPVTSPSARVLASMAYDAARGEMVLFGGGTAGGYDAETWTYNGSTWQLRTPPLSPPARATAGMTYDPVRERVVLHGGEDEFGFLGDTWEWDGTTWKQIGQPVDALTSRSLGELAYDVGRQRVMRLNGGGADTWEYDGTGWTELTAISPVTASTLAYDAARNRLVASGSGKTFELIGTTWTELAIGTSPPTRAYSTMVYDARRREVVLHGGDSRNDTWRYNASSTWALLPAPVRPDARYAMGFAYDSVRDRLVMFGGEGSVTSTTYADTWEFDGAIWKLITTPDAPTARKAMVMAYDVARKRVVLFGGRDEAGTELDDTWEYDGTTWTSVTTATVPDARAYSAMTYDPDVKRVVMVGGIDSISFRLDDIWGYDGIDWAPVAAASTLGPIYEHGIAYDESRNLVVSFGGYSNSPRGDTWAHDGATWTELGSPVGPVDYPALAYLPARQRIVRMGGYDNVRTHELDGAAWRLTASLPYDRYEHRLATDALRERILLYGGFSDSAPTYWSDDLWEYRYRSELPDELCAAGADLDGDGLVGCADPDCTAACSPMCPPLTTCPVGAAKCGDGTCGATESKRLCPADCGTVTPICGDGRCDSPETATTCPADC